MSESREERMAAARTRMAELAAKFIDRSRADLNTMRDGLAKLAKGDLGALVEIRHLAHRMAGTGATLGFDALGECASRTEALIDSLPPGVPPDAAALARLAAGIGALESQLANLREK
jgi:HPt (histidine-containing phosphotransfer) domain-containing protein